MTKPYQGRFARREAAVPALPLPPPVTQEQQPQLTDTMMEIVRQWDESMDSFARCFDIRNKDTDVVAFVPSDPQRAVWAHLDVHHRLIILKGRQMWITTAIAMYVLRLCLLHPGFRAVLPANDDRTAGQISEFYRRLHSGNALLAQMMPTTSKGVGVITFANGSQVMFGTANSPFWKGQPNNFAHCTEAADYDDLGETLGAVGNSIPASGWIVLESTAAGENAFYDIWQDKKSKFVKLFLSWLDHNEYFDHSPLPSDLTDIEQDYLNKHPQFTPGQRSWWVNKHREQTPDKQHLIFQYYPVTAEEAFILSGDKFLRRTIPMPLPVHVNANGVVILHPYDPACQYSAGVDTASGSEKGDFCTVVLLDITHRRVAATLQIRLPHEEFKYAARDILRQHQDPLTVVEINSIGMAIMEYLRGQGVPQFMALQLRGLAVTTQQAHGWTTDIQTRPILYGGIYDATCGMNRWTIGCPRLVMELNALAYNKQQKPEAPKGHHDDLAVAFGLAIQGVPQASPAQQQPKKEPPRWKSPAELEWEAVCDGSYQANLDREVASRQGDFFD